MKISLYDSYSRSIREFEPLDGNEVRMYACGPTVYDYAHIGNLRTYIFEDVLRRTLESNGYNVKHVVNITDVGHLTSDADTGEDKIEKGSRRTGKTAWEIAELYTEAFKSDLKELNIREPAIWCRATDHIAEQIIDIQTIQDKGFAYQTSDGVYFDTSRLDNYGYLARLDREGLNAGERVDIGEKRHATDFALWKFSPKNETRQMEWESPWGIGFPGWHIECSAMAVKFLGKEFDIHCGGKDHIPVHHTNEIAQSEVCYGTNMANFWIHGYFLETDRSKMSKSSGEFLRLKTLHDNQYDPLAYRYLCLTANYRSDLKFTWESLDAAQTALGRLRNAVFSWAESGDGQSRIDQGFLNRFQENVYYDLNTTKALAVLWDLVKSNREEGVKKATIFEFDKILGLNLENWAPPKQDIPEQVMKLVNLRLEARQHKNWSEADSLREKISQLGFEVEDSPEGPKISKK
jgi:cysteinyl-tRNA synthetase